MSRIEKLHFPNTHGELLSARLDVPDKPPQAYALLAHCFTCNKSLKAAGHIAKGLVDQGIAVFRFDFTGLGESEGDFSNTNFTSNVQDIFSAARFMEQQGYPPHILVGHSLGGTAVLKSAAFISSAKAVVTIGSPASPSHVAEQFSGSKEMITKQGEAIVTLAGRDFIIRQQFIDDLEHASVLDEITQLKKALLVMHAPLDKTVGIKNAGVIFQAAHHPKSYISLDQSDHLLSKPSDAHYVGLLIAAWVDRYLND
ncbi:MAG: osmotically inducible protein OsmC [Proteobacteria bacterium]|nr:MAG: osmotically inducible protein OsmC [Pseudomonadota bacterium]